jgi:hypothetical protein
MKLVKSEVLNFDVSNLISIIDNHPGKEGRQFRALEGYNYRVLSYVASQYKDSLLCDIGTRRGASALALSTNISNQVISWDIKSGDRQHARYAWPNIKQKPNIEFRVMNIFDEDFSIFDDSKLIYLDISHDGKSEKMFYDKLSNSKFSGILVMDDINYPKFNELRNFWISIDRLKVEIDYAHYSGLGFVSFGEKIKQ